MNRWRPGVCCLLLSAALAGILGAQAPAFKEPKWPQPFTLERGDRTAYGIAVGAPGAIVVRAEAKGAVIVSIVKPNGTVARELRGMGSFRLDYQATREDVALGMGWRIGVRDAAAAPVQGGRLVAPAPSSVLAGTLFVEHPAGDPGKVKVMAAPPKPPPAPLRLDLALAEIRASRAKVAAAGVAKRLVALQPKLPPVVFQAMSKQAVALPEARKTGVALPIKTSAGSPAAAGTSTQGASRDGSSAPATAPLPLIASLDTSSGSPGQQVLVTGSGFGPTPGEVHFLVAPGKDLPGTVTYWSDAQIVVGVPSLTGVLAFAGQMYVRNGTTNSRLVPFRFEPELDYAILPVTADQQLQSARLNTGCIWHDGWPGIKGDDEFFLHTTLKNGWVVDDAYVVHPLNPASHAPDIWDGRGDAYVSAVAIGSASPRIRVHWWGEVNGFYVVTLRYMPVVVVRGPKGLPPQ